MSTSIEKRQTPAADGAKGEAGKDDFFATLLPETTPDRPWRLLGGAHAPEPGATIELVELPSPTRELIQETTKFVGLKNGYLQFDSGGDWLLSRRIVRSIFWRLVRPPEKDEPMPSERVRKIFIPGAAFLVADTTPIYTNDLQGEGMVSFDLAQIDASTRNGPSFPSSGLRMHIERPGIVAIQTVPAQEEN